MTVVVVSSFCLALTLLMPTMMQPLSLGLCVMILSACSCVMVGLFVSSWYGYVLFLVYVGGLLVMFAYVAALAPNSFFSSVSAFIMFFINLLFIMVGFSGLYIPSYSYVFWGVNASSNQFMKASGSCIASPSSMSVIIILSVILLVNLLAVVKICYYQQGPLRSYFELK